MINRYKWINSLPKSSVKIEENNKIDHSRWVNTIPQKNTYKSQSHVWKYSLLTALFVCGCYFVSAIKNETRNLEKEIERLRASNNVIKFNLDQAILDNEVITSPENITRLAKEHLNINLVSYKKSQIIRLPVTKLAKEAKNVSKLNKKNNNLSEKIKIKITKKVNKKKEEIRKLQALYHNPESIPGEVKLKIKKKKSDLKNLYSSGRRIPKEKVQKWVAVQAIKVFLGIPVVPGR